MAKSTVPITVIPSASAGIEGERESTKPTADQLDNADAANKAQYQKEHGER